MSPVEFSPGGPTHLRQQFFQPREATSIEVARLTGLMTGGRLVPQPSEAVVSTEGEPGC